MALLVSYDPGKTPAWALFETRILVRCARGRPTVYQLGPNLHAVIEEPMVYPHSPIPPNDLIPVAIDVGEFHGLLRENALEYGGPVSFEHVKPRQWKGQVPKPKRYEKWDTYIIHQRILKVLDKDELKVYLLALATVPEKQRHNIVDAVGIGLHHLGRLP